MPHLQGRAFGDVRTRLCPAPRGLRSMLRFHSLLLSLLLFAAGPVWATVFATVHGVVHDPQHRPVAGAEVTLKADGSDSSLRATTDRNGEFELPQTPIG